MALRRRLTGAVALTLPVLAVFALDAYANLGRPGIWLFLIAAVFIWTACGELHRIFRSGKIDLGIGATIFVSLLALAVGMIPVWVQGGSELPPGACGVSGWGWCALGLMGACALRLCLAMFRFEPRPQGLAELAASLFVMLYVTLPLMFLLQTRLLWNDALGLWAMGSVVWIVKMSDSGAYFSGRLWGRTPMALRLSPKKTIEGAIGGLVAGMASSAAFFLLVGRLFPASSLRETSPGSIALYGITLGLGGILGDLSESLLKRHAGQKDSSAWIPGLGGTLDVFDSILFAAPLGYFLWASGLVGSIRHN